MRIVGDKSVFGGDSCMQSMKMVSSEADQGASQFLLQKRREAECFLYPVSVVGKPLQGISGKAKHLPQDGVMLFFATLQ